MIVVLHLFLHTVLVLSLTLSCKATPRQTPAPDVRAVPIRSPSTTPSPTRQIDVSPLEDHVLELRKRATNVDTCAYVSGDKRMCGQIRIFKRRKRTLISKNRKPGDMRGWIPVRYKYLLQGPWLLSQWKLSKLHSYHRLCGI